jgi:hypothetical protein
VARTISQEGEAMTRKIYPEGHELGELVEEYGASSFTRALRLALALALVALGLFLLWLAVSVRDGLLLLPSLALLLAGVYVIWVAFRFRAGLRVLLFEGGFVHLEGGRARRFRWEEIESVHLTETQCLDRCGNAAAYTHSFRIRAAGGREVVLDDTEIGGGEDLGRAIMREVQHFQLKGLLRRALQLEAAGEWALALATFEELLCESPYNEIADQAREHIQRLHRRATLNNGGQQCLWSGSGPLSVLPCSGSSSQQWNESVSRGGPS